MPDNAKLIEFLAEEFCLASFGDPHLRLELRQRVNPTYWETVHPDVQAAYRRGVRAILPLIGDGHA